MNQIPNNPKNNSLLQNQPQNRPQDPTEEARSFPFLYGAPYAQPSVEQPKFAGIDALFAWLSILVGFLFVRAMPVTATPLGGMLFLWLLFAFGAVFLRVSKIKLTSFAVPFFAVAAVFSLGMLTNGNRTLRGFLFLFLTLGFIWWCYISAGLSGKRLFSENPIAHLYQSILVLPITSIWHIFPAFAASSKGKKSENSRKLLRTLGWIALGLAVAVIPTAIVVLLLSYDDQFMDLLSKIFSFSLDGFWELIGDLILGFLCAIIIFAILSGVKQTHQKSNGEAQKPATPNVHVLPSALLYTAVTPILAVYVIFFISQWDYYISAFTHTLPGDLTYAAYAREGFFQLCGVSALNAVMLLLFNLLMRRKEGQNRSPLKTLYSVIISAFTLILIATALSKMVLYIDSYGLTQKRVYASWFMLLLAVIFVLVLVGSITKKQKLFPAVALTCVLFFALIALPNLDSMIASYNVDAYLSGNLDEVDIAALEDLGSSAVPALVELKEQLASRSSTAAPEEEALVGQIDRALKNISLELNKDSDSFFNFNIPDYRARTLLE